MNKRLACWVIVIVVFTLGSTVGFQRESPAFLDKVFKKESPPPAHLADYETVTWDTLGSFEFATTEFEMSITGGRFDTIPQDVMALNGKKVAVDGFMIPASAPDKDNKFTEFILVKDRMSCCFGVIPKIMNWSIVNMTGKHKAPYSGYSPIKVYGTLEVGEKESEDGIRSLYRMQGEYVEVFEDEEPPELFYETM